MPRCYPPEPGFGSGRTAERQVWEVLRDQLPADAALLHSVTMIERATEYEADLVVGWPGVGVAVIEVKGGHISRDQGQWHQSSGIQTARAYPHMLRHTYVGHDHARCRR